MGYDLISAFEVCGLAALTSSIVGFCMILIGARLGRREFRSKGFLRTPAGIRWFRFLLWKQYDVFDNPMTRKVFEYAHFCLMATIILVGAIVALFGCNYLLNRM